MLILGIETSCDETGAAVIEGNEQTKKVKLLSNVVASSLSLHSKTGGIIPENAAREQVRLIIPVIKDALERAGIRFPTSELRIPNIDAIALTYGPGLVGSLLIGTETAKTLSYVWNKPIIPVNHLIGHIYANFVSEISNSAVPQFPAIGLIVSGGHTDLILMTGHGRLRWLGGTRDDAAGEALDKIGRLLGLPYPGGPHIEEAAKNGNPNKHKFPSPLIGSADFDFSFSGLKTAVFREVATMKQLNNGTIADISASAQKAVVDVLVHKTLKAARQYSAKSILLGGGVAANNKLREQFELSIVNGQMSNVKLFAPQKFLCTDNAVMIAAAAFFNNQTEPWQKIDANPNLYFDSA